MIEARLEPSKSCAPTSVLGCRDGSGQGTRGEGEEAKPARRSIESKTREGNVHSPRFI